MVGIPQLEELKSAHSLLTGGQKGAPRIQNGARIGNSILRSSVVMMSAILQAKVEDTFRVSVSEIFTHFSEAQILEYCKDNSRWGNPNTKNIEKLFFRIGIPSALDGLSWKNCSNQNVRKVLDNINQIRNDIAHGGELHINGNNFNITSPIINRWVNFTRIFSEKFEIHIKGKI